jgi:hypothetical protein
MLLLKTLQGLEARWTRNAKELPACICSAFQALTAYEGRGDAPCVTAHFVQPPLVALVTALSLLVKEEERLAELLALFGSVDAVTEALQQLRACLTQVLSWLPAPVSFGAVQQHKM